MILFIATGGTIDKLYPRTVSGYSFEFGPPAVSNVLSRVRPSVSQDVEVVSACAVDSQDMTEENKDKIWEIVCQRRADRVIVTHGTDTIIQTGNFLDEKIRQSNRNDLLIILTGAFLPESFKNSDADFNIGLAIGGLSVFKSGVFVALNGSVLGIHEVERTNDGTFKKKL